MASVEELYFVIAAFLESQGLESAPALVAELMRKRLLPEDVLWNGGSRPMAWPVLKRKVHVPGDHLLQWVRARADSERSLVRNPTNELASLPPPASGTLKICNMLELGHVPRRMQENVRADLVLRDRIQPSWSCRGHTHNQFHVVFAPAGGVILTAGDDGVGKVWSQDSGELLQSLRGPVGACLDLQTNTSGSLVAFATEGEHQGVTVFRLVSETGRYEFHSCIAVENVLQCMIAFVDDVDGHSRLVVAHPGGLIRLYEAWGSSGWQLRSELQIAGLIWAIDCETNLLCVGMDNGYELFMVESSGELTSLSSDRSMVAPLIIGEFSPAGEESLLYLSPSSGPQPSRFYNVLTRETELLPELHKRPDGRLNGCIHEANFSCFGRFLFVIQGSAHQDDCQALCMRVESRFVESAIPLAAVAYVIRAHPNIEAVFMVGCYNGKVLICDGALGRVIKTFETDQVIQGGDWSPDGLGLAFGGDFGRLDVFGLSSIPRIPAEQFLASDYDPTRLVNGRLIDVQSGLSVEEHHLHDTLVSFQGVPLAANQGVVAMIGHVSPADWLNRMQAQEIMNQGNALPNGGGGGVGGQGENAEEPGEGFGADVDQEDNDNDNDDDDVELFSDGDEPSFNDDDEDDDEEFDNGNGNDNGGGHDGHRSARRLRRRPDRQRSRREPSPLRRRLRSDGPPPPMPRNLSPDRLGGNADSPQRRSKRTRKDTSLAGMDDDADFDDDEDIGGVIYNGPLTVPQWCQEEEQSVIGEWYVPQRGDCVRVFYAGLEEYVSVFCPNFELPTDAKRLVLEGLMFKVSHVKYQRYLVSGIPYCSVVLRADGDTEPLSLLELPFHPSLTLSDYMVPATRVEESQERISVGLAVQAHFADQKQWFPARVVELRPNLGWSSVGVRWAEDEDANVDWVHPWELFLEGQARVREAADADFDRQRLFGCFVEMVRAHIAGSTVSPARSVLRKVLSGFEKRIKSSRFQRGHLVCPVSVLLLLRRLQTGYYRRLAALIDGVNQLLETLNWLDANPGPMAESAALVHDLLSALSDPTRQPQDSEAMAQLFADSESCTSATFLLPEGEILSQPEGASQPSPAKRRAAAEAADFKQYLDKDHDDDEADDGFQYLENGDDQDEDLNMEMESTRPRKRAAVVNRRTSHYREELLEEEEALEEFRDEADNDSEGYSGSSSSRRSRRSSRRSLRSRREERPRRHSARFQARSEDSY